MKDWTRLAQLTADTQAKDKVLTVSSTKGMKVGQWIRVVAHDPGETPGWV